jgi:hypothetical protein
MPGPSASLNKLFEMDYDQSFRGWRETAASVRGLRSLLRSAEAGRDELRWSTDRRDAPSEGASLRPSCLRSREYGERRGPTIGVLTLLRSERCPSLSVSRQGVSGIPTPVARPL